MLKTIQVFKVGEQTDSAGNTYEWTEEDVKFIANFYNEMLATDPSMIAPLCKGHPEDDAPAFGWVKSLSFNEENGILEATIDFNETIVEEIKGGMFKKVSIALYDDKLLRHIGMLGAAAPAVKGLEPVEFKARKNDFAEWNFEEGSLVDNQNNSDETTQKTDKELLAEREEKYGIGRKDNLGYLEKPSAYKDVEEEQFADPVNYLFPLHDEENVIASYSSFRDWEMREKYTSIEKQVISARILKAIGQFGIDLKNDNRLYYSEGKKKNQFIEVELKEAYKRDKPEVYADYSKSDFADPVHFRFPIKNELQVRSSIALVHRENATKEYTEKDLEIIRSRILNTAMNIGINLNGDNWQFATIPIDIKDLSKQQLVKVLDKNINNSNNNKEFNMNEWLTKVSEFINNFLANQVNDEVASAFQPEWETFLAENPAPSAEPAPEPQPQFTANELAMKKKIEILEAKDRYNEYSRFADEKIAEGKMLPAEKNNLISTLELAYNNPGKAEFSFGETKEKMSLIEAIKNQYSSRPAVHKLEGQFAQGGKEEEKMSGNDRANLHQKALEYQEQNQGVSYEQAVDIVYNKNKNN